MPRLSRRTIIVLTTVFLTLFASLALAQAIDKLYIVKLYCNDELVAIGIIERHGVTAYPPVAVCGSYILRTGRAILYLLSHGALIGSVYTASIDGLRLRAVLYAGHPGYYALPILYTVLIVLLGLAVFALLRREELELL